MSPTSRYIIRTHFLSNRRSSHFATKLYKLISSLLKRMRIYGSCNSSKKKRLKYMLMSVQTDNHKTRDSPTAGRDRFMLTSAQTDNRKTRDSLTSRRDRSMLTSARTDNHTTRHSLASERDRSMLTLT